MAGKVLMPATKSIPATTDRIVKEEEGEEGEHLMGEEGTNGVN